RPAGREEGGCNGRPHRAAGRAGEGSGGAALAARRLQDHPPAPAPDAGAADDELQGGLDGGERPELPDKRRERGGGVPADPGEPVVLRRRRQAAGGGQAGFRRLRRVRGESDSAAERRRHGGLCGQPRDTEAARAAGGPGHGGGEGVRGRWPLVIGALLVVAAIVGGVVAIRGGGSSTPVTTLNCIGGSEKTSLMADADVTKILHDRYHLAVNFTPLGSYDQVQLTAAELKARSIDCLWPSSASAQLVFEKTHPTGTDFPAYRAETVLQSPEVLYAGPQGTK